MTKTAAYTTH